MTNMNHPQKRVLITLNPIEIEFPEDWSDERITDYLASHARRALLSRVSESPVESWKYTDEWRN